MILILTAGFGDGHNTAARNVAQALERLSPGEQILTLDLFDIAHPVTAPVLKWVYQFLITGMPALWAWTYQSTRRLKFAQAEWDVLALLREALAELMAEFHPRAVVSSYPLYARMMEQIAPASGVSCPLFTVVTDSISIHPTWALGVSDLYFVADEASKQSLAALGVSSARITVSGFPVSLDFTTPPEDAGALRDQRSLLYLPSTGVSHVRRTLDAVRPLIEAGAKLTLPAGKHLPRLYQVLRRFVDSLPEGRVEVIGWTSRIPRLLQTHDLVICKAGGAILHEALAACCPAIIDYVVPGQEEGNAELLTSHECGVISRSPRETGQLAGRLLENGAAEARRMSECARAFSEPGAALKIATELLVQLASSNCPTASP